MQHTYKFKSSLQNSRASYEEMANLCETFSSYNDHGGEVIIDFSNVAFVAANLLAIIGCILDSYCIEYRYTFKFYRINEKIKTVMKKNGFGKYFKWENCIDTYGTTIAFKRFGRTQIAEFERHTVLNVLNAPSMPNMSPALKDRIIDRFLEIFNNVIDHTHSSFVYTCGQFFPKKNTLCYTIVDKGETISYNVNNYMRRKSLALDRSPLEWAIEPGNSTNETGSPGGLGLHLIIEFIKLNNGEFILISGNECFEYTSKGARYLKMNFSFPGTIVTTSFNLSDTHSYILSTETLNEIRL